LLLNQVFLKSQIHFGVTGFIDQEAICQLGPEPFSIVGLNIAGEDR
jgi:hypothetical protein